MRKLLLPVLLLLTCCVNAQVYQARDLSIGLSAGMQVLSFDISDTAGYRDEFTGLRGQRYAMHAEFGLSTFMGIGMSYSFSPLEEHEGPRGAYHAVSEFTPEVSYHVPWKNQFIDLSVAVGLGLSKYRRQLLDVAWTRAEVSSVAYFAEVRPRFYFSRSNRLGASVFYRFTYFTGYGSSSDKTTPPYQYDSIGRSHAAGLGLFYRFGKSRGIQQ